LAEQETQTGTQTNVSSRDNAPQCNNWQDFFNQLPSVDFSVDGADSVNNEE